MLARSAAGRSLVRWISAVLSMSLGAAIATGQPLQLPGAGLQSPSGAVQPPPPTVPGPSGPATLPGSLQRQTTLAAVRPVPDDAIVGLALLQNGRSGRVVMERIRGGYGLRFSGEGFQINNLTEPCGISFGDTAVPLESLGRPEGLPRFRLKAPVCPIEFDVMPNAMLVIGPATPCIIEAAQCRLTPTGLWGPDGRGLVALASNIERERARADTQVREGFRNLSNKVGPEEKRAVAREQAGFSSEREQICRDFYREANHSFCAAKVTEARAAALRVRLMGPAQAGSPPRR